MSTIKSILEEMDSQSGAPYTEESAISAFAAKIAEMGLESVTCDYVAPSMDGSTTVGFSDIDSSIDILFCQNDAGQWEAIVLDPSEDGIDDITIDLSPVNPPSIEGMYAPFIDLSDLSWMNLSTLKTILTAGRISDTPDTEVAEDFTRVEGTTDCFEAVRIAVDSTGKVRRIPIVRKKKRIRTAAQKAGARKAALKRAHDPDMKRKRAKAMLMRSRLHLK